MLGDGPNVVHVVVTSVVDGEEARRLVAGEHLAGDDVEHDSRETPLFVCVLPHREGEDVAIALHPEDGRSQDDSDFFSIARQ